MSSGQVFLNSCRHLEMVEIEELTLRSVDAVFTADPRSKVFNFQPDSTRVEMLFDAKFIERIAERRRFSTSEAGAFLGRVVLRWSMETRLKFDHVISRTFTIMVWISYYLPCGMLNIY